MKNWDEVRKGDILVGGRDWDDVLVLDIIHKERRIFRQCIGRDGHVYAAVWEFFEDDYNDYEINHVERNRRLVKAAMGV